MIIRPSFTVLSGATIGLIAGAAVYGAVSSSATPTLKPTKAVVAAAPAAASCAKGQKLEDGVCVIHVVRTVVVPAPAAAQLMTTSRAPGATSNQGAGSSASGAAAATKGAHDAEEVGHEADDATEAADGAAEGTAPDVSADRAASDDSNVAAH